MPTARRRQCRLTVDKEWQKAEMRNANGIPFSPLSSFTAGARRQRDRGRESEKDRDCTVVRTVQRQGIGSILCKDSRLILFILNILCDVSEIRFAVRQSCYTRASEIVYPFGTLRALHRFRDYRDKCFRVESPSPEDIKATGSPN